MVDELNRFLADVFGDIASPSQPVAHFILGDLSEFAQGFGVEV